MNNVACPGLLTSFFTVDRKHVFQYFQIYSDMSLAVSFDKKKNLLRPESGTMHTFMEHCKVCPRTISHYLGGLPQTFEKAPLFYHSWYNCVLDPRDFLDKCKRLWVILMSTLSQTEVCLLWLLWSSATHLNLLQLFSHPMCPLSHQFTGYSVSYGLITISHKYSVFSEFCPKYPLNQHCRQCSEFCGWIPLTH